MIACLRSRHGLVLMLAVVMTCAAAPGWSKVLATVDGDEITDEDVRTAFEDMGPTMPQMPPAARQAYLIDYLIVAKLVAHRAAKQKLGATADFERRMNYYRQKLLMQGLLGETARAAVTEDTLRSTYDNAAENAAKKQLHKEEIHARHILLPTEAEAKAALKRIQGGEDFAKVATELSKDPGGAGGDLGWFTKSSMVDEFAEAAFRVPAGEVSQPIRTQFGWHIIKVEERRLQPFPTFDQVRDQIQSFVVHKANDDLIKSLRQGAKIVNVEPANGDTQGPMANQDPAPSIGKRDAIEAGARP